MLDSPWEYCKRQANLIGRWCLLCPLHTVHRNHHMTLWLQPFQETKYSQKQANKRYVHQQARTSIIPYITYNKKRTKHMLHLKLEVYPEDKFRKEHETSTTINTLYWIHCSKSGRLGTPITLPGQNRSS